MPSSLSKRFKIEIDKKVYYYWRATKLSTVVSIAGPVLLDKGDCLLMDRQMLLAVMTPKKFKQFFGVKPQGGE